MIKLCAGPPPETGNAAPDGPRNGVQSDIEVGELPNHDTAISRIGPSIIFLHPSDQATFLTLTQGRVEA